MKKRLAAFAVAGGLAFPVATLAQVTEVHVYGTLLPFLDNVRTTGATDPGLSPATGGASQVPAAAYTGQSLPNRLRITSGTSNLGFKGSLKLGEQFKVVWQVESAIGPDGDGPNALAGRNSGLGLSGDWGTVFYGNWDTPYKFPTLFFGPVRGLSSYDNAVVGNPGFNVPGTTTQAGRVNGRPDAAFNRRQGNSVQYWSPTLYGLSARLAYSVNEGKTAATPTTPSISPQIFSGLLTYENGPFGVRYAYELHDDYFGMAQIGGSAGATAANPSSRDQGHEIAAWYTAPTNTKVSVIAEHLIYDTDDTAAGAVNHYDRDAFYLLVQQRLGDHQIWGAFGHAFAGSAKAVGGAAATTNGLSASQWSIGYTYALAKSAEVFASFFQMINDRSASYALFPPFGTVAPGATSTGFGLGLIYTFDASWTFGS